MIEAKLYSNSNKKHSAYVIRMSISVSLNRANIAIGSPAVIGTFSA
jgi:hypothetical protein